MIYKAFGYLHAQVNWRVREFQRLAGETGQGTADGWDGRGDGGLQ